MRERKSISTVKGVKGKLTALIFSIYLRDDVINAKARSIY